MRNKIFYNIYLQVFLPFYLFTFLPLSVSAQRIGCVHTGDRPSTRGDNQVLAMRTSPCLTRNRITIACSMKRVITKG